MKFRIDALGPDEEDEIRCVATRMQLTLIEVLGEARGRSMYSMPWLVDRVYQHLNPSAHDAVVFVARAEADGQNLGHTIVRAEVAEEGAPMGLFSTSYVLPSARRNGIAEALLRRGETWMREQGLRVFATHTSGSNTPLIRLYEKHGYDVVLRMAEDDMVRLAKSAV